MLDIRYILGRDNYSCIYCGEDQNHIGSLTSDKEELYSNVAVMCDYKDLLHCGGKYRAPLTGRLIVVTGSMYSEKTTTTRSLLNNYEYILGEYIWVKPDIDNRGLGVTTHNKDETQQMKTALTISSNRPDKHLDELLKYPIVAFDEGQFFSERIIWVIHKLLEKGRLVIVNGLKLDYKRNLFGVMHYLLAEADEIINVKAVCSSCKTIDSATRTKRVGNSGPSVKIGGTDEYYVVCPDCEER